jgi:hypothetical protein
MKMTESILTQPKHPAGSDCLDDYRPFSSEPELSQNCRSATWLRLWRGFRLSMVVATRVQHVLVHVLARRRFFSGPIPFLLDGASP